MDLMDITVRHGQSRPVHFKHSITSVADRCPVTLPAYN